MQTSQQIAKHFKETFFGGNWTAINLKETIQGITWQQATTKVYEFNTIAALVFHINYYVAGVLEVFKGNPLVIKDEFSFDVPNITSQKEWKQLTTQTLENANEFTTYLEKLPENIFSQPFTDVKYGNYYRNLHGIIEHTHYHLGQIMLIKKMTSIDK